MILPDKSIQPRPIATNDSTCVAPNAGMLFLMTEKLVTSPVGPRAAIHTANKFLASSVAVRIGRSIKLMWKLTAE
jgi:hypothetical protein